MSNLTKYYGGSLLDSFFDLDQFFGSRYGADVSSKLRTHVDESDEAHIVKAEVPGLSREDIDVAYENDVLSITINYKDDSPNVLRRGKYQASWSFRDVNPGDIEADMNNGLLIVTLPKTEKAKPRRIEIKK